MSYQCKFILEEVHSTLALILAENQLHLEAYSAHLLCPSNTNKEWCDVLHAPDFTKDRSELVYITFCKRKSVDVEVQDELI